MYWDGTGLQSTHTPERDISLQAKTDTIRQKETSDSRQKQTLMYLIFGLFICQEVRAGKETFLATSASWEKLTSQLSHHTWQKTM